MASPPDLASSCWRTCACAAVLLVLAIIVLSLAARAYLARRLRRLGPPADCSEYPGLLKFACDVGTEACAKAGGRDARACDAAVGACMPLLQAVRTAPAGAALSRAAPHVPACAEAVYKVSPAGAARAVKASGVPIRVPAGVAALFRDPEARQDIQAFADFAPDAARWGLAFGQDLARPDAFTPGPTQACAPLCPKAECYADAGCGPAGYCMAYFADDPTYGGACAPA